MRRNQDTSQPAPAERGSEVHTDDDTPAERTVLRRQSCVHSSNVVKECFRICHREGKTESHFNQMVLVL